MKRKVELVVISDVHLGTFGCQAKSLNRYLKSIEPDTLILNGDIIDIWQFSKSYWPDSHMKIIHRIFKMLSNGTKVYYLTGNHDEMLRRFVPFSLGKIEIVNKLVLELDGKKAWFFHGDVFDVTMQHSKWLAKLGAIGYDTLILLNSIINWFSQKLGKGRISLSKKVKNSVKKAVKFIDDFETTATDIAIENGFQYVVCGHIHQAQNRMVTTEQGQTQYLNSGDWIENLTALEYHQKEWTVYYHNETNMEESEEEDSFEVGTQNMEELLQSLLKSA